MSNSWTKTATGWGVQCDQRQAPGATVTVTKRDGTVKIVTLGAEVGASRWGFVYAVAEPVRAPVAAVGSLAGILAMLDRAATKLRYPAIQLGIEVKGTRAFAAAHPGVVLRQVRGKTNGMTETKEYFLVRVSVAGAKAKVPGSLTILSGDRDVTTDKRSWFGRVTRDGTFAPSRECPSEVAPRLAALAADPAKVAGEAGRLVGRCVFCSRPLSDQRSTDVGYGETCASNYGLPWGVTRTDLSAGFVAEPVQQAEPVSLATEGDDYGSDDGQGRTPEWSGFDSQELDMSED